MRVMATCVSLFAALALQAGAEETHAIRIVRFEAMRSGVVIFSRTTNPAMVMKEAIEVCARTELVYPVHSEQDGGSVQPELRLEFEGYTVSPGGLPSGRLFRFDVSAEEWMSVGSAFFFVPVFFDINIVDKRQSLVLFGSTCKSLGGLEAGWSKLNDDGTFTWTLLPLELKSHFSDNELLANVNFAEIELLEGSAGNGKVNVRCKVTLEGGEVRTFEAK
jgi:hypothetical protein